MIRANSAAGSARRRLRPVPLATAVSVPAIGSQALGSVPAPASGYSSTQPRRRATWFGRLARMALALAMLSGQPLQSSDAWAAGRASAHRGAAPVTAAVAAQDLARTPVSFEENRGQAGPDVRFFARGSGYTLYLTNTEAIFVLRPAASRSQPSDARHGAPQLGLRPISAPASSAAVVRLRLIGSNPSPEVSGQDQLPGTVNYFLGNDPKRWQTGVRSYSQVRLHEVYRGIDMVFHGGVGATPEYDFVIAPGADPRAIQMTVDGATRLVKNADGSIQIQTAAGNLVQRAPATYQDSVHGRTPVSAGYTLSGGDMLSLWYGSYDHGRTLIFDPALYYSTFLGGNDFENPAGVVVDSGGNLYVDGYTDSCGFPTTPNAIQAPSCAINDAGFITKLSPDGRQLIWSTYFSGTTNSSPSTNAPKTDLNGIAVDSLGAVYVAGLTTESDFPAVNAFQPTIGPVQQSAVVAKIAASGSSIVYSTYLHGSTPCSPSSCPAGSQALGVAVDTAGEAYVVGNNGATDFPTMNPLHSGAGGFLTKLTSGGNALAFSTAYNGDMVGVAVDGSGDAYVAGDQSCAGGSFQAVNAAQPVCLGGSDTTISKIKPGGPSPSVVYATYLGGSAGAGAGGIALDPIGEVYVTGTAGYSTDFPLVNAFQGWTGPTTISHGYLTKVSASGSSFVYSTYYGGTTVSPLATAFGYPPQDDVSGVAVDANGLAYVTGFTNMGDLPTVNALFSSYIGSNRLDGYLIQINTVTNQVPFSSYLGGTTICPPSPACTTNQGAPTFPLAVAVDGAGVPYVAGNTYAADFPTASAFQPTNHLDNAFISKVYTPGNQPPLDGAGITTYESLGNFNGCWACFIAHLLQGQKGDPVNTATGNFTETDTDLRLNGRGLPLMFSRTYNSLAPNADGPLGFRWSLYDGPTLTVSGSTVTIAQENGSQVSFNQTGPTTFVPAAPRFIATLTYDQASNRYTFTRQASNIEVFSGTTGNLVSEQDLNGYVTGLSYDGDNRLSTVTEDSRSGGRSLSFSYIGSSIHIATAGDSTGRTVSFSYDGSGNLTDVIDVNGEHTHYGYDPTNHLLTTIQDPNCTASPASCTYSNSDGTFTGTANVYDSSGRVIRQYDPIGRLTSFDYTSVPGSTITTDPANNRTLEQYQQGVLTATTRGYGTSSAATWTYSHDPASAAVSFTTDPNGHTSWRNSDTSGNMLTTTDPLGNATITTYNALNEVSSTTDPAGITTANGHDAAGNLLWTCTPVTGTCPAAESQTACPATGAAVRVVCNGYSSALPGDLMSMVDPDGNTWTYTYDGFGNRTSESAPGTPENTEGNQTTWTYNADGWVTSSTRPMGTRLVCQQSPGCPAQWVTTYDYREYDTKGQLIQPAVIDEFGDLGQVVTPQHRFLGDTQALTTTTHYDADRNATYVMDGDGNITHRVYDAANQLTDVIRPANEMVSGDTSDQQTDYDGEGHVLRQINALTMHQTPAATCGSLLSCTSNAYDPLGHLSSTTDPDGLTTSYVYDAVGNLLTKQDPAGSCTASPKVKCTSYTHDADNRLASITYSDGTTPNVTGLTYDRDGRRTSVTDGSGTTRSAYDNLGRLTVQTNGAGETVRYAYDGMGHVTSLTYPDGNVVTRDFDPAGRMDRVKDWMLPVNQTSFSYDSDSNLVQETYPNGVNAQITHDHADETQDITDNIFPQAGFLQLGTSHDGNGQVDGGDGNAYGYDPNARLTCASPTTCPGNPQYAYDAGDELIELTSGVSQSYEPSGSGELTSRSQPVRPVGAGSTSNAVPSSQATVSFTSGGSAVNAVPNDIVLVGITALEAVGETNGTPNFSLSNSSARQLPNSPAKTVPTVGSWLYWYRETGTESSVTIKEPAPLSFAFQAVAVVYRGVDPNLPVAAATAAGEATVTSAQGSQTPLPVGPVTAATAASDELVMFSGAQGGASSGSWIPDAAMHDEVHTPNGSAVAEMADQTLGASGLTGTRTATFTQPAATAGMLVSLKPQITSYVFDARGNRTKSTDAFGNVATYGYDLADRLTFYGSSNPTGATSYAYDADGLRTSKNSTHFAWDRSGSLPLLLNDGTYDYIYGPGGQLVEQVNPRSQISRVAAAANVNPGTNLTDLTLRLNLGSNLQAHDLVVLGISTPSAGGTGTTPNFTLPAGYTAQEAPATGGTWLYTHASTGTEGSSITITETTKVPYPMQAAVAVYRGVDLKNPFDGHDSTANSVPSGATTIPLSPTALTATTSDDELVLFQAAQGNLTAGSWSVNSGMGEQARSVAQASGMVALADKTLSTSGSTGSPTAVFTVSTGTVTGTSVTGAMLALRPSVYYLHQDQLGSTRAITDSAGNVVTSVTYNPYGNLSTCNPCGLQAQSAMPGNISIQSRACTTFELGTTTPGRPSSSAATRWSARPGSPTPTSKTIRSTGGTRRGSTQARA
jgi:YD repeat-containing protein